VKFVKELYTDSPGRDCRPAYSYAKPGGTLKQCIMTDLFIAPVMVRNIATGASVCLSVCLSVCPLAHLKNHSPNFIEFSLRVTGAVARSSSDDSRIRYVLPVL